MKQRINAFTLFDFLFPFEASLLSGGIDLAVGFDFSADSALPSTSSLLTIKTLGRPKMSSYQ